MTITDRFPNVESKQPAAGRRVFRTDGRPISVLSIAVGQPVFLSDGHPGWITRLLPSRDGWVGAFAIRTRGWWRRKVVIPINNIDRIEGDNVYLSLTKKDLKKLPTHRPDDVLAALVNQALWEDTILRRTEYRQIHVEVENGIAYLSGYVSSHTMSKGAEKAAYKVDGVWNVVNGLAIDGEMQIAVSQAIGNDARTKKARIFVGVHNGFVTLTGHAPDPESRLAAQDQAAAIPGVRGVINSIRLPGADADPRDQRAWQPAIGAGIYATDMAIGKVEKVVVDPGNRLVTAILADAVLPDPAQIGSSWLWQEHMYSKRRIVIPIEMVRHLTSTSVFLTEKGEAVAALAGFDSTAYAPAPVGWEPPYPYKSADILLARDARTME